MPDSTTVTTAPGRLPRRSIAGSQVLDVLSWALAVALTVPVFVLHVQLMQSAGPLWRDEVNTVHLSALPDVRDIWKNSEHDSFPILWFVVLHAWQQVVGTTDDGFRSLGLLMGLAGVAAMWITSRRMRTLPLIPLVLYGMNPEFVRWGDSMRAYGLGVVFALLLLGEFWCVAIKPSRWRLLWVAVLGVLAVQTLYYNAVILLAVAAGAAVIRVRRGDWRKAVLVLCAGLPAAASLVPYHAVFARVSEWNVLIKVPFGWPLLFGKLHQALSSPAPGFLYVWFAVVALCVVGANVVAWAPPRADDDAEPQRDLFLFATLAIAVAVPGHLLLLWTLSYPTEPWYYITLSAFLAQAAGGLTGSFTRDWARVTLLLGVIVATAVAAPSAAGSVQRRQTTVDVVSAYLSIHARPSDLVLVHPWTWGVTMSRYYGGPAPWHTVPPIEFHRWHRYDLIKQRMMDSDPLADTRRAIAETLQSGGVVWVVNGVPEVKEAVPANLPPPPLPVTGWNVLRYERVWVAHIASFLHRHALHKDAFGINIPASRYESASLQAFRGWRAAGDP